LPSSVDVKILHQQVKVITQTGPLKVSYHHILDIIPPLIRKEVPDLVLHIGLDSDRTSFAIELGAEQKGYHQTPDIDRKVVSKTESKAIWGKGDAFRLDSSMDLNDVLYRWRHGVSKGVDVQMSDDVGTFVCGFVYYTSLNAMANMKDREKPVLFLHIPPLSNEQDLEQGKKVVIELIRSMAESWQLGYRNSG
jgi:pyrrolidone-carboxylate peptidase